MSNTGFVLHFVILLEQLIFFNNGSTGMLTLKRRERIGTGLMDPELEIATSRSRVR